MRWCIIVTFRGEPGQVYGPFVDEAAANTFRDRLELLEGAVPCEEQREFLVKPMLAP